MGTTAPASLFSVDAPASGRHSLEGGHGYRTGSGSAKKGISEFGLAPRSRNTGGRHRPDRPRSRIASLDGLRGVAALVVVVHHVFLTQPALAAPYLDPSATTVGDASWWATYSPLHLLWAGTEAVFVFFVLSGLVLTLPVADKGRLNLRAYYPRRLLRLYLPVWASVVLAVVWALAFPRTWQSGDSWWLVEYATNPTLSDVLDDTLLLWWPGSTNHVLWSLQWEVIYCLALPLVLIMAKAGRQLWHAKALLAFVMLAVGAWVDSLALFTLPMFMLGTLMAVEHRRVAGWAAQIHRSRNPQTRWWATLLTCIVLLMSYWLVHATRAPSESLEEVAAVTRALQVLGACLLIFLVWHWPSAQRFMKIPLMQWLGTRSFSLYLVHLPVVISVTVVLGHQPSLLMVLMLTVAITLPVAEAFYRLVEKPSHGIARTLGRLCADRTARAPVRARAVAPSGGRDGPAAAELHRVGCPSTRFPSPPTGGRTRMRPDRRRPA